MKQRFTLFIATLILSVCFPLTALAYDVVVDGIYYNLVPQIKTAVVTSGDNKYTGEITIPKTITVDEEVYNVTSIGRKAFSNCANLTSVTIPNSVTIIGENAFSGCEGLPSVTIPNSVTSIGHYAFSHCANLTSITIPNSVTGIGYSAFSGCTSLSSISVAPNNTIFDSRDNCNAIIRTSDNALIAGCQSTIIPNSVTSIGNSAFDNCSSLTSVTIPNSVTSIGDNAFRYCSSLTSITIPNSVTSIGNDAFHMCSRLTSVTIGNSVTSIGNYAFYRCFSLTSVMIPNSVTSIGGSAFRECSSLTSVTIPNSVTSIGSSAFYYCTSLTSVTIPNSVTSIEWGAFADCKNLENVYCYAETVPETRRDAFYGSNVESATLYVHASAIDAYKTTEPWSKFGTIQTLEGTEVEIVKCETPTIAFSDGRLTFSCATDDVEYVSEVKCADVNTYYTAEVALTACYDISVTATKTGYENSDVATAKIYWLTSSETSDDDTGINSVSKRGIAIQTAAGFITISGLDDKEKVDFYTFNGTVLGTARATNGVATFSAQSGSVLIARIGNESVKIIVE